MAPRADSSAFLQDPPTIPPVVAADEKLSITEIRRLIPEECFKKSLPKSLWYMFRDMGILAALWVAYPTYVAGSWPLTFVWWNAMGFMMWCLFVVGHDCGHGTFSNYKWVNDIIGHLCHAPLCVPFWPWAKSHRQHHQYHNHVEKDMSFPWFSTDTYNNELTGWTRFILKTPLHPLFSYGVSYLFLGYWDGSHFNPLDTKLFWNRREQIEAGVSVAAVAAWLYVVIAVLLGGDMKAFGVRYAVPWMLYNYWLVMVTYMQHHEPDTKTYDETDFNFTTAAMETVDRSYCWGIDDVHHNITDGHVVHHLFFTKIPHYNLIKATKAVRPYLEKKGVYRYVRNPLFLWDFVKYNSELGLFTHSKAGRKATKAH